MTNEDYDLALADAERAIAGASPYDLIALPAIESRDSWLELRAFVKRLRVEMVYGDQIIPRCWYRHSALSSVLFALMFAHQFYYEATAQGDAPATWHQRLAAIEPRLKELAARTNCSMSGHREDTHATFPDDNDEFQAHVERDFIIRQDAEYRAALSTDYEGDK